MSKSITGFAGNVIRRHIVSEMGNTYGQGVFVGSWVVREPGVPIIKWVRGSTDRTICKMIVWSGCGLAKGRGVWHYRTGKHLHLKRTVRNA